jgi:hypothetical protein
VGRRESTRTWLDPLRYRTFTAARYILLLADTLNQENEGMAELSDSSRVTLVKGFATDRTAVRPNPTY